MREIRHAPDYDRMVELLDGTSRPCVGYCDYGFTRVLVPQTFEDEEVFYFTGGTMVARIR